MYFEFFLQDCLPRYGTAFVIIKDNNKATLDGFVRELRGWIVEQAKCLENPSYRAPEGMKLFGERDFSTLKFVLSRLEGILHNIEEKPSFEQEYRGQFIEIRDARRRILGSVNTHMEDLRRRIFD
jgi:hypothetical protein